jgi:surface antigen
VTDILIAPSVVESAIVSFREAASALESVIVELGSRWRDVSVNRADGAVTAAAPEEATRRVAAVLRDLHSQITVDITEIERIHHEVTTDQARQWVADQLGGVGAPEAVVAWAQSFLGAAAGGLSIIGLTWAAVQVRLASSGGAGLIPSGSGTTREPVLPGPGQRADGNLQEPGYRGECTWGASELWHQQYGWWPNIAHADGAKAWGTAAEANGFAVASHPLAGSIVVFPPGGSHDPTWGHVAFVDTVRPLPDGGQEITIRETNYGNAPRGTFTIRQLPHAPGYQYVTPGRTSIRSGDNTSSGRVVDDSASLSSDPNSPGGR